MGIQVLDLRKHGAFDLCSFNIPASIMISNFVFHITYILACTSFVSVCKKSLLYRYFLLYAAQIALIASSNSLKQKNRDKLRTNTRDQSEFALSFYLQFS